MADINHVAVATVTQTCFACPEQYEGTLLDGSRFLFTYRWGMAGLTVWADPNSDDSDGTSLEVGDRLSGIFESQTQRDETFASLYMVILRRQVCRERADTEDRGPAYDDLGWR